MGNPNFKSFQWRIWDSGSYSISRWIFNIVYFFQWEIPTFSITFLEGNPHLANLRTVGSRIVDLSKVLFISSAVVPWAWLWVIWNHGGWWSHLNTSNLWILGGTTYFWILDWVCRSENTVKIPRRFSAWRKVGTIIGGLGVLCWIWGWKVWVNAWSILRWPVIKLLNDLIICTIDDLAFF